MTPSEGNKMDGEASLTAQGSTGPAVQARGVWKAFGATQVLRDLELSVRRGECMVIFGANGSGKTTLIKILATLMKLDAGEVFIDGLERTKQGERIRGRIGVVGHQTLLYEDLTPYENLRFYGLLYGIQNLRDRVSMALQRVGMERHAHQRVRTLSHGMQKRVSLARAVLHHPRVLLLDEPESGLDQEATQILEVILRETTARSGAVVMTTHNLERGLALGHRVAILAGGRIAYQEERKAIKAADFPGTLLSHTGEVR